MKRYNKETNQFETYSFLEDKAEEDLIRKLEEKNTIHIQQKRLDHRR